MHSSIIAAAVGAGLVVIVAASFSGVRRRCCPAFVFLLLFVLTDLSSCFLLVPLLLV